MADTIQVNAYTVGKFYQTTDRPSLPTLVDGWQTRHTSLMGTGEESAGNTQIDSFQAGQTTVAAGSPGVPATGSVSFTEIANIVALRVWTDPPNHAGLKTVTVGSQVFLMGDKSQIFWVFGSGGIAASEIAFTNADEAEAVDFIWEAYGLS
jgi:hypothetical protein